MKHPSSLSPRTLARVQTGLKQSRAGQTAYIGSFGDVAKTRARKAACKAADAAEELVTALIDYAPARSSVKRIERIRSTLVALSFSIALRR